jgi:hypothetical protein
MISGNPLVLEVLDIRTFTLYPNIAFIAYVYSFYSMQQKCYYVHTFNTKHNIVTFSN